MNEELKTKIAAEGELVRKRALAESVRVDAQMKRVGCFAKVVLIVFLLWIFNLVMATCHTHRRMDAARAVLPEARAYLDSRPETRGVEVTVSSGRSGTLRFFAVFSDPGTHADGQKLETTLKERFRSPDYHVYCQFHYVGIPGSSEPQDGRGLESASDSE